MTLVASSERGFYMNVPAERPRKSREELDGLVSGFKINRDAFPLIVIGVRGFYRDSMGAPGVNDRGIYDDAIFVLTVQTTTAFNGNTDPSAYRKGAGYGNTKGMASLNTGAWFAHQFGMHKGKYLALCQTAAAVTVTRDGDPPYPDTGYFGINIHKGSYHGTSSEGCQTIHPDQWESFISLVKDQAKRYSTDRWQKNVIPYVLIDEQP
jgi:hypothetical protein